MQHCNLFIFKKQFISCPNPPPLSTPPTLCTSIQGFPSGLGGGLEGDLPRPHQPENSQLPAPPPICPPLMKK